MNSAFKPVWGILIILLGVIAVIGVSSWSKPKEVIRWRTDWDAARAEAQTSGKPVFAYFSAEWCGPCQGLKHTTWADPKVEAALRDYVPVKVDVDRRPDLARRYVVTPANLEGGIPAFRVLDGKGEIVREAVGAMAPEEFVKWIAKR
jgi:thiol:disulfide interchange protein